MEPHRGINLKVIVFLSLIGLSFSVNSQAATVLSENFDNVSSLASSGWVISNQSTPAGLSDWFQGNTAVFASQSGAADSYIAANFEAAGASGNISDWLITPALTLTNGATVSFYTRSDGAFADGLELRFASSDSVNVGSTASSLGDFTNLLLSVNPSGAPVGYPTAWTRYTATLNGFNGTAIGRLAFRYLVSNTAINGDYIGIDTLSVASSDVPEPATASLFAIGVAGYILFRRNFFSNKLL